MITEGAALTTKGEQTRALILETALALFQEQGYEQTTMRAIAERAGVALGSTYYYFRSKEQLIQAFYHKTHIEHLAVCAPLLAEMKTLEGRLQAVMRAKLETIAPYHRFAGILFKSVADPQSPLNPFSPESALVRDEATALFAEVVEGANERVPADLAAELPMLLWTYHMGILLFWVHDRSPNQRRTQRFTEHTVDLIVQLIWLGSLPLLFPVRRKVLALLRDLRQEVEETTEQGEEATG